MKKLLALLFALLATPAAAQTIPSGAWGSINYWGVGGLSQVLAPGLAGQCLTSQNVGSAPIWVNCQVSSLSLLPPINANSIMANNTLNFVAPQAIDVNRVLDMVGYDIIRPPAVESIIYKSNVGPNFNWQTLPPSTAGSLLTSGGPTNPPFWAPSAAAGNLASICQTVGAVLYFDTPSLLWKCLNPGTSGQLLQTGGAAANPSWLTVTAATTGSVPSTRNVNTSSPLGGGGALSADLTLTCPTCATTTNGGALSATAPETLSAAGVIACPTCATTTNGGALSATAPETISAAGVIACPTCATTTNGGALSATAPETISAAGVIACPTCATTTNGGALSATAPETISAAGVIACATCVAGAGSSVVGDLPTLSNTTTTGLVDSGFSASQLPGVIPSTATVTITNASPAVIAWTAHGLAANTPVVFSTTGALPTGLTADTGLTNPVAYYVVGSSITANTFQVATTIANAKAGISVNTSSAGSGTQTATANSVACTGCIGEYIWATVPFASRFAITTGTITTIQTLSITPGIYSCAGEFGYETTGGGVATEYHLEISTTAPPTIVTAPNLGGTGGYHLTFAANQGQGFFTGPREVVAIANPTTVYQKTLSTFTNSQTTYGFVGCRRVH